MKKEWVKSKEMDKFIKLIFGKVCSFLKMEYVKSISKR